MELQRLDDLSKMLATIRIYRFSAVCFHIHSEFMPFNDISKSVQKLVVTFYGRKFSKSFFKVFSSNIHNLLASKEHTCINN